MTCSAREAVLNNQDFVQTHFSSCTKASFKPYAEGEGVFFPRWSKLFTDPALKSARINEWETSFQGVGFSSGKIKFANVFISDYAMSVFP